jgi:hypothetical protein
MGNSPRTASIHILDDDSLLNVFLLYRPFLLGEDQDDDARLMGGERQWVDEQWWYKPAQVCQRWRNLITQSASHLGLSLVCTKGTPVADMLAHSPHHLPLVIDYFHDSDIAAEDEEGAVLALKQRDRVRRVRLHMPVTNLKELIVVIDEEFPILEYLVIMPPRIEDNSTILRFPETLHAPHLRHLALIGFDLPKRSRLLTTAVGLVTLCLIMDHPSTYFSPDTLLQWLSSMPQLKTLVIAFSFAVPNRDVEKQRTPVVTTAALPYLRYLRFRGVSTYLEALVHRITTTSRPEKLEIDFFNQLTFSVPRLLQFLNMNTTENPRLESAKFVFRARRVDMEVYPRGEADMYAFSITVDCGHLDWQVSSVAQISNSLSQLFSAVEHLTLEHEVRGLSPGEHNEVNRTEWCKLLRSFRSVKTLRIDDGLVEELSQCLELDGGRLPLWLLPELQELQVPYSEDGDTGDAFSSFIEARQNAGYFINLVRRDRSPSPDPSSSAIF